MIIEYDKKYDEDIKNLLVELQEHIVSIDKEGYNRITNNYKEEYFKKVINEIDKYQGRIFLYIQNNKCVGLIAGYIYNEKKETYDFKCPKRGNISELVVSKVNRNNNIGTKLLKHMNNYLRDIGCERIMIGVFAYNDQAIKFYEKNGYHTRMIEMISNE